MMFFNWIGKIKKLSKDKPAADVFSEWETLARTRAPGQDRKLLIACISSITSEWAFRIKFQGLGGGKVPINMQIRTRDLELVSMVVSRLGTDYEGVDDWAPAYWSEGFHTALYIVNQAQEVYLKYAGQSLEVLQAVAKSDVPCPDRALVQALYEARLTGNEYKTPTAQFWPYIEVCCLLKGDRHKSEYLDEDFDISGFTDWGGEIAKLKRRIWG
jgi:hypothetical protein